MKIMLYGGTFDPPHNGHINNLRAALALVRPDRAIVMPAGTPPHKQASTTPAALRLQMCACFTALSPVVEVSDWEIQQGGRSYTVHTLEWLRSCDPAAELYLCVGSDMLLCRMFFNLVENAVKYNRPGGMVKVDVQQRDGQAVIHVADTGRGIPQEFWQSIFQPFFRVDKSLSRELGGAGLGLPLVWEIARLHGGRVWVEESNDSGSVLAVTLPLSASITDTVRG